MLLEVKGLCVNYGRIEAIRDINFTVEEGEIVTLIGANGAGKTTTLKTISGLRPVTSGTITFDGEDITGRPPHRLVEMGVCQAPEGRGIFPGMSVMENLEMGTYARRRKGATSELDRVLGLFPRLAERRSQAGGTLSGGEQQMLAIGRALLARPRLLLLDEPSLGLAPQFVRAIFAIIREINQTGTTIFLVEQNVHMALAVAARGYVIETGQIVLADTPERLLANEDVKKAYLGE